MPRYPATYYDPNGGLVRVVALYRTGISLWRSERETGMAASIADRRLMSSVRIPSSFLFSIVNAELNL
jgi:hypothetical protein